MSLRKFVDQEEAVWLLGEADRRRLGVTEGPGATASTDPSLTSGGSTGGTRAVFPLACGSSIWCRGVELVPRPSATGCPGIRACVGDLIVEVDVAFEAATLQRVLAEVAAC
jgi:hypothetical protein